MYIIYIHNLYIIFLHMYMCMKVSKLLEKQSQKCKLWCSGGFFFMLACDF